MKNKLAFSLSSPPSLFLFPLLSCLFCSFLSYGMMLYPLGLFEHIPAANMEAAPLPCCSGNKAEVQGIKSHAHSTHLAGHSAHLALSMHPDPACWGWLQGENKSLMTSRLLWAMGCLAGSQELLVSFWPCPHSRSTQLKLIGTQVPRDCSDTDRSPRWGHM